MSSNTQFRDRTREFKLLIDRNSLPHEREEKYRETKFFSKKTTASENFAARIGLEIYETNKHLNELQSLISKPSVLDDKAAEIQAITFSIRQAILKINNDMELFNREESKHNASVHSEAHHRSMVLTLRVQWGDLALRLKQILENRAERMRMQEQRGKLYFYAENQWQSQLPSTSYADSTSEEMISSDNHGTASPFQTMRRQNRNFYQTAREEAVENVQRMVTELAQVFNRVASLVSAQEELTTRIEDDMSSALGHLYQGELQLLKYFKMVTSNRRFILKVFAVLAMFILFSTIFLL